MLVQALAAYADTYLADQLADEAFEEKPVPYEAQIFEDGTFARIRSRMQDIQRGKKTFQQPLPLRVPKSPVNRNAEVYPLLGCDAVQYLFGPKEGLWTKPDERSKHQAHHDGFMDLVRRAAEETQVPALRACAAFYGMADEVNKAREALAEKKPRAGSLIALAVVPRDPAAESPGGPVVENIAVREYWRKRYATRSAERMAGGGRGMCLISGKIGPIAPTHDRIKGVANLGGQPSGVSLMSFDKHAFRSYGWEQNANSPVSPDRAAAYVMALNDLLKPGVHRRGASRDKVVRTRFDCGEVGFLFWTRAPSDDDIHALFHEARPEDVHALLSAPHTGRPEAGSADPNDFYLVAVSGNGGRLLVRYWFHDKLCNVRQSVRSWFENLRIADVFKKGENSDPPKLWELLAAVGSRGRTPVEKANSVPADRAVQLMRRALHGLPLGRTTLAAALGRLRVEAGKAKLAPVRLGLVRMCVNDIESVEKKGEPLMAESLDESLKHPAYICGRLLAVYDRLQYAAQGDVNVTVADRYYGMASTLPQVAFPKLEHLSKAHLRKLRRDNPGAAVNITRELGELIGVRLGAGKFPPPFSLEDQGRFVIGFHHQKAEDQKRIAEAKARKAGAAVKSE